MAGILMVACLTAVLCVAAAAAV